MDSSFAQGSDPGIVVSNLAITVPGVEGAARRRPIVRAVTVEASLATIELILRERLPALLAEKGVEGELVGIGAGDNALLITVRLRHPRLKLPFGSAIPIEPTIAVVPSAVQGVLQFGIEIRELGGKRLPFVVNFLNFLVERFIHTAERPGIRRSPSSERVLEVDIGAVLGAASVPFAWEARPAVARVDAESVHLRFEPDA